MKIYAEGMKYFNKQSFRRARALFEKVASGFSRELAERARVHIAICEQRLQRPAPVRLRGTEDHYHYAVAKINTGEYDEANVHLHRALKLAPKADYVYYALATVAALTGEAEEALGRLERAIKLRPENRYQARNDADFKLLEDDVRFQELVYPDRLPGSGFNALGV
jgi:tetratricopeptide (TPR) repeat protein